MTEDPRWNFLQEAVQKTLNIKADKWAKYIGNEEQKLIGQEFLDKKDALYLVMQLTQAGQIEASLDPPFGAKSKGMFFMKKR
jgi:hypothetical protein